MFLKIKVKYLSVIFSFLCFSAFAQLSPRDAAYYQSAGAFKNPEFVERGDGWELTGCVSIPASYSTATFPYANRSLNITCLAETLTVKQCTDKFDNLQAYVNAYGSVTVGSSLGNDVYWRVTDGTNTLYEGKVPDDGKLHLFSAPLLFAQDNLCIEIVSVGDITGTVALTQNNIEVNKNTSLIGIFADSTGWEPKGPITITSTGTDPTKGTTTIDSVSCRRDGPDLKLQYVLNSGIGGDSGTGDYLFSIEDCAGTSNIEIDSDLINFYADTIGGAGNYLVKSNIGTWELSNGASTTAAGKAIAYDSTKFRLAGRQFTDTPSITTGVMGGSFLGFANPRHLAITISVPIKQWRLGTTGIAQRRAGTAENSNSSKAKIDVSDGSVIEQDYDFIESSSFSSNVLTLNFKSGLLTSPPKLEIDLLDSRRTYISDTGTMEYTITDLTSSGATITFTAVSGTGTAIAKPNGDFWITIEKSGSDFDKSAFLLSLLRQSSIVQDVEQFPTTEQKLCDACYKGKALYKICRAGSTANGYTFASDVTELASSKGSVDHNNNGTWFHYPFRTDTNSTSYYPSLTGGLLSAQFGGTRNINVCHEYTKD